MHINRGIRAAGVFLDFYGLIRSAMQSDQPYCVDGRCDQLAKALEDARELQSALSIREDENDGLQGQLTEARAQLAACQSREAKALAMKESPRETAKMLLEWYSSPHKDSESAIEEMAACLVSFAMRFDRPARDVSAATDAMAEAFIGWPLPDSVNSDLCATVKGPGRIGTHLLSFTETKKMFRDIVGPRLAQAEADRDQLQAQVGELTKRAGALKDLLERMLFVADNVDENGYVTDVGFYDVDGLHDEVRGTLEVIAAMSSAKDDQ